MYNETMDYEKPDSRTMTVLRKNYEKLQRQSELLEMYKLKCAHLTEENEYQRKKLERLSAVADSDEDEKRLLLAEKFDRIINEIELLETEEVRLTDTRFDKSRTTEDEFQLAAESIREENAMNVNMSDNVYYMSNSFSGKRTDPVCPECSTRMKACDPVTVSRLSYIDKKITLQDDTYYAFLCEDCGYRIKNRISLVKGREPLTRDDRITAELLSYILTQKYDKNFSFFTQSIMYANFGVHLSYYVLARWCAEAIDRWIKPVYRAICDEISREDILYCDNITLRCFDMKRIPVQDTPKTMWVYCTPETCKRPMVIYDLCESDSCEEAAEFLKNFKGTIVVDKFGSYSALNKRIRLAGSWALVRLLFSEAYDDLFPAGQKNVPSHKLVSVCRKLYRVEESISGFDNDIRLEVRERNSAPLIDEAAGIIRESRVIEKDPRLKSELAAAADYFMKNKERLRQFTKDGRLEIDNISAKYKLIPFAGKNGRKLVCVGEGGRAEAIYSVIESAKVCGLDPDKYLCYIMKNISSSQKARDMTSLLPWNAPEECRSEFTN